MRTNRLAAFIVAIILVAVSLTACGGNAAKKIIGTWVNSQSTVITGIKAETSYTFNEDGTGSHGATLGTNSFTYVFNDEGKLVITEKTLLAGVKEYTYTCEFEDDVLKLTDADGVTVAYTKQVAA